MTFNERKIIIQYKKMIKEAKKKLKDRDKAEILELLASLHFIHRHGYPKPKDFEDSIHKLIEKKPKFLKDAEKASTILIKVGLI